MAQEVLKNTGLKIGLRITSADDRGLLGSTMAASALQLERMSTFAVGEALIFYEKLLRPFTVRLKEWWGEIGNRADKADMVTPKNDEDLRKALIDRATYRDENIRSIRIIGAKYYNLLLDMENRLRISEYWLKSVAAQADMIDKLYAYLEQAELGRVQISDDEKQTKYDQLEALQVGRANALAEKAFFQEPIDIIDTIRGWVYSLERMKNGRWTRFGAPEDELCKITLLQSEMCDRSLALHKQLVLAAGTTDDVKRMDTNIRKMAALAETLDKDLRECVERFGTEVFTQR